MSVFRCLLVLLIAVWVPLASAQLEINDGFIRGLPPGQSTTAAFMTLHNPGTEPVVLVGGRSDIAAALEVHGHQHTDGMMRMRPVPEFEIAAGGTRVLSPGSYHLMIIGLNRVLVDGDKADLVLIFADGKEQALTLPVQSVLKEGHNGH